MPIPASTTQARKADWKPSVSTTRGDRPEADPEDDGLSDDRADRDCNREHDRAEPEFEGRVAEHLLGVEREDERYAGRERAGEHHRVRADERARAEQASAPPRG
jgi:hypothetical protein